jgi:hypothetical protein
VAEVERAYSRVVFAVDTVTHESFSVKMTEPRLAGWNISFIGMNDTLPGINAENFFDYLQTNASVVGTNSDTVSFDLSITSMGMKKKAFSIPVTIDALSNSGKIGTMVSANETLKDSVSLFRVKTAIRNLAGKELRLMPVGASLKDLGKNWVFGVGHVFDLPKTKEAAPEATSDIAVPAEAGISGNYPNPFNPSTDIRYQLPGPSRVTLKIYDVLGREVEMLVNAELGAGYHSAKFNGSRLASGIYFARLSVTPLEGSDSGNQIVQTVKMMLAK